MPELLDELLLARNEAGGRFRKLITMYKKVELLIIDEMAINGATRRICLYII
ncbi:hypothetical protein [Tetragenococcus halophilus]|uniref:hypothetical protein n=1 Tax=Tetragenococcus halophilus TaxID=51669 RepID=UPI00316AC998